MKVDIYKNLHRDCWSVRDRTTGLIVDHVDHVIVKNVSFIVQPAGRKKVLQNQQKNVHAFVRGVIDPAPTVTETCCDVQVKYNPYKADHFYKVETGEAVSAAQIVVLDTQGAWIQENASTRPTGAFIKQEKEKRIMNIPIWKAMEEKRLRKAYENAKRNSVNYSSRLHGCECARWENHEGRCQSAYCYCH